MPPVQTQKPNPCSRQVQNITSVEAATVAPFQMGYHRGIFVLYAVLAQLDRVAGFEPVGRGSNPHRAIFQLNMPTLATAVPPKTI